MSLFTSSHRSISGTSSLGVPPPTNSSREVLEPVQKISIELFLLKELDFRDRLTELSEHRKQRTTKLH